jgi:hypothetical protein
MMFREDEWWWSTEEDIIQFEPYIPELLGLNDDE